jgi:ribosomal protein S18 acetylase RimI-like enzyme
MDSSTSIQPAAECSAAAFVSALNSAYADYFIPIHLTPSSLETLIRQESIDMQVSRVALSDGEIVGMGLLGQRGTRGWIGGMGVIPDYRRQGIARRIMQELIAQANGLGLETLQLEVIQQNQAAYNLYQELGFVTGRELIVLACRQNGFKTPPKELAPDITLRSEAAEALLEHFKALPGVPRPWQREYTADRLRNHLTGYAAYRSGHLCGACLFNGSGGLNAELADLAADDETAGVALLARMLQAYPTTTFTCLNVSRDDLMLPALRRAGFEEIITQYEMVLALS